MPDKPRILLIDLNNFARYPTMSIGYLASLLRRESMAVEVFSPLSTGVTGVAREPRVRPWGLYLERMRYWTAMSRNGVVRRARHWLTQTSLHASRLERYADRVANDVKDRLQRNHYDAVFISTYLIYRELCEKIGTVCDELDLPLMIGGPYFAHHEIRREWMGIPGMTALAGGEVEHSLGEITRRLINGGSLDEFPGIWTDDPLKPNAPPLRDLDSIPFPDFSDFPWEKYPNRIVPMTTGRGCGWGACTFCSDVTGTAGRTFRSRSPENVLEELRYQSERFNTDLFVFADPKLNSNLEVWESLLGKLPTHLPNARWLGAIHIGTQDQGLDRHELRAARAAGMVRLTTGLESGSQQVLDLMKKGTSLPVTSRVIRDAAAEGISVRVTMIVGYPGEETNDVHATARFLEDHGDSIERVTLSRFHIRTGTQFYRMIEQQPQAFPQVVNLRQNHEISVVDHDYTITADPAYRRAISRVLCAAHRINRRPLRPSAREFDGVM